MTTDMSLTKKHPRTKEPVRLGIPPDVRSANEKKPDRSPKEAVRLGIPPDVRLSNPQELKNEDRKTARADRVRRLYKQSKKKSAATQGSKTPTAE